MRVLERRGRDVLPREVMRVELEGRGLDALPLEALSAGVELLSVSRNRLAALPEEAVPLLSGLRALGASHNCLRELPAAVLCGLPRLEALAVANNALEQLPRELGGLRRLVTLSVGGNRLRALPDAVGELVALASLSAHGNELETLPASIGKLTRLATLRVDQNRLRSLPRELGRCTALKSLRANSNLLEAVPEELGALGELTGLMLGHNPRLRALPTRLFARLHALEGLSVAGCPLLEALPDDIGSLPELRGLCASGCALRVLPPGLDRLDALWCLGNDRLARAAVASVPCVARVLAGGALVGDVDLWRRPFDEPFDAFVSLGFNCTPATVLREAGLRECALPFDWSITSRAALEGYFGDGYPRPLLRAETAVRDGGTFWRDAETGAEFWHERGDDKAAAVGKAARRCSRLHAVLGGAKRALFVRLAASDDELDAEAATLARVERRVRALYGGALDARFALLSHTDGLEPRLVSPRLVAMPMGTLDRLLFEHVAARYAAPG